MAMDRHVRFDAFGDIEDIYRRGDLTFGEGIIIPRKESPS